MRVQDIRLQQRDLAILTELADTGVLDAPTIGERHFGKAPHAPGLPAAAGALRRPQSRPRTISRGDDG